MAGQEGKSTRDKIVHNIKKLASKENAEKVKNGAKKAATNTLLIGLTVVILGFFTINFLGYTGRLCTVGALDRGGISQIVFKDKEERCADLRPEPPAPTPPGPTPPLPRPDEPGPDPVIKEKTLDDLKKDFDEILSEARVTSGNAEGDVPSSTLSESLKRELRTRGGLLWQLYSIQEVRPHLGFEFGAERRATLPKEGRPGRCRVYSKSDDIPNDWILIRSRNGQEIVRFAAGGIPDGPEVYTDLHLNLSDAQLLGLNLSGDPDDYSQLWISVATQAERTRNKCI